MQFSDCRMPSRVEDIAFIICEQQCSIQSHRNNYEHQIIPKYCSKDLHN